LGFAKFLVGKVQHSIYLFLKNVSAQFAVSTFHNWVSVNGVVQICDGWDFSCIEPFDLLRLRSAQAAQGKPVETSTHVDAEHKTSGFHNTVCESQPASPIATLLLCIRQAVNVNHNFL